MYQSMSSQVAGSGKGYLTLGAYISLAEVESDTIVDIRVDSVFIATSTFADTTTAAAATTAPLTYLLLMSLLKRSPLRS
jgi:hypothetical protein